MGLCAEIPEFALPVADEVVAVLFLVVFRVVNLLHEVVAEFAQVAFRAVVFLGAYYLAVVVLFQASPYFRSEVVVHAGFGLVRLLLLTGLRFEDQKIQMHKNWAALVLHSIIKSGKLIHL